MGERFEVFLVKHFLAAILAATSLGFAEPAAASVNAADYDAFWLWAGVTPQPVLARVRSLYILPKKWVISHALLKILKKGII